MQLIDCNLIAVIIKNITKMDKENHPRTKSPLKQANSNFPTFLTREESKYSKHDQILSAIEEEINSNSCNILDVILGDPLIKELNTALEKQAEKQKKNKLLQSFPHRYRSLIQTQHLYMKLQESLKESEKCSKEVIQLQLSQKEQLLAKIQYFQHQVQIRQSQIKCLKQDHVRQREDLKQQFEALLSAKQQQIEKKNIQLNDVQRKLIKTKCEKQNILQYLEEMKEQTEILKKENQRIIQTITSQELQINKLTQELQQQTQQYTVSKEKLIENYTKIQIELQNQVYYKNKQCSDLIIANEAYQSHLRNRLNQIQQLKLNEQTAEAQRYEQIQQVRAKLLQSIRQKNELDLELEKIKQGQAEKIQSLQGKIQQLQQSLKNKDIQIQQKNLNNELEIHKIKQMIKKIEESKDETIQQIRQNINLVTQEKLLLQGKVLKLQTQKESVLAQNEKLKIEVDSHQKKMLQISWNTRKSQVKGVEIQKMVSQFKEQLSKFQQIISEKEQKIQQYRKEIINLRARVKAIMMERDEAHEQLQKSIETLNAIANEKDKIKNLHSKCIIKQNQLLQQIQRYNQVLNKPTQQQETQFEIIQGINDSELAQIKRLQKQLQKSHLKYQNILEELQQYKKQFKEESEEKETFIKELQDSNKHIKEMLASKLDNNSQISTLLSTKIEELKSFYEKKMEEEDRKYRKMIEMLKTEVTELYKEIDLKKSMEEEMFNQIMKVNKGRKTPSLQLQ